MEVRKFRKLMGVLQQRKEEKGDLSPEWLLGFVEGYGKQCLTGYQIGALMDLILIDSHPAEPVEDNSASVPPVAAPPGNSGPPGSFNFQLPPR